MSERHVRLSINVDHVATVRQVRRDVEPDPVHAAVLCELAGADGITIHLREDRRHISDRDVRLLRETVKSRLNLEMAGTDEMVGIACDTKPEQATLVPEKRQELTTEGGLDVLANQAGVAEAIGALNQHGIFSSIFIEADPAQIAAAAECGARAIELHTGRFAEPLDPDARAAELEHLRAGAEAAHRHGLAVHAGHGLTYQNIAPIARLPHLSEVSIGHNIIARAIMVGLDTAVREMRALINGARPG